MITIEQASNGFILRRCEEDLPTVFMSEIHSMNHALGALFVHLQKILEDEDDTWVPEVSIKIREELTK